MKRSLTGVLTAAVLVSSVGLATTARADMTISNPSVYLWTGHDYSAGTGRAPGALNKPGDVGPTTWTWQPSSMDSQPLIDPNGRIFFRGQFTASPQINTVTNAVGIFTATNNVNVNPLGTWATGQLDATTGLPMVSNAGSATGLSTSSYMRISGTQVAIGARIGNPTAGTGIFESTSGANLQNNMLLYSGAYNAPTLVGRAGATISTLSTNSDWTAPAAATGVGSVVTTYQSMSTQSGGMNSAGTHVIGGTLATTGATPATAAITSGATATPGNRQFLGTITAGGQYNVIARSGDLPYGVGGPAFKEGSNGVGGFNCKINQNGQVLYDAAFFIPTGTGAPPNGGVTSANDASGWIYTPGAGNRAAQNTQFYQESLQAPAHNDLVTGLSTSAGTATFNGGVSFSQRGFSNAGVLWTASPTGGDTVATGSNPNSQMVFVSTVAGGLTPTFMIRQNDIAPGFTAASDVRQGVISSSNNAINNSGRIAYTASLQGTGVTASVAPVYTTTFPPPFGLPTQGPPTITPGSFGNEAAVFTGLPGITGSTGLKAIARKGDLAPGMGGLTYDLSPSSTNIYLNNAGDVLISASVTNKTVGQAIDNYGAAGPQLSFNALFGYSAALDTVTPLLFVGQGVEVEAGVTKYVTQFAINGIDDGNGSSMGFNDNGQAVAWVRLSDTPGGATTSTSYIVLQVPAAGTGSLALLGLGAMARRRRR